jgi:trimeric autotransporter adhesin
MEIARALRKWMPRTDRQPQSVLPRKAKCTLARRSAEVSILLAVALLWSALTFATQYAYDGAGRLIATTSNDGNTATYTYDAAGNITHIERLTPGQLAVLSFSPAQGSPGDPVTILGAGFSTSASLDVVKFNGVSANVVSASATQLIVQVPNGASSGPISVAVSSSSAASAESFIVTAPPVITGLSPTVVDPGAPVTISGNHLSPVRGASVVSAYGYTLPISSSSDSQIVVMAPSLGGSGPVQVTTPYGQTTSTDFLVIAPSAVGAASITSASLLNTAGSAQSLSVSQQGHYGIFALQATVGQYLSVQLSSLTTTPAAGSLNFTVYSPTNSAVLSGSVSASTMSIHLPPISVSGTYLIAFHASSSSISAFQVTGALEANAALTPGTALPTSTTVAGQSKRFVFSGAPGQTFGVALTGLSLTPSTASYAWVGVVAPDGSTTLKQANCFATATPGCQLSVINLSSAGTYSVEIVPNGQAAMSGNVTVSPAITASLSPGSALPVSLSVPGVNGWVSFTVTAGQTVALSVTSLSTTPANQTVTGTVYNSSLTQVGGPLSSSAATGFTFNLTDLAAGTYSLLLVPSNAATASMQVSLATGLSATLPTDGTTTTQATTLPGQNGYLTFAGTAGQNIGIGITGLTLAPNPSTYAVFTVIAPNGTPLKGNNCFATFIPGCQISILNLPATGIYSLQIVPNGQGTVSANLTISQDVAATVSPSASVPLSLSVPGANGWVSFTVTAGQTVALSVTSLSTTPANQTVTGTVYNSSLTQVGGPLSSSAATGFTFNLTDLAAGTYSLLLVPSNAATASMQVGIR